jgi:hypothetical protein
MIAEKAGRPDSGHTLWNLAVDYYGIRAKGHIPIICRGPAKPRGRVPHENRRSPRSDYVLSPLPYNQNGLFATWRCLYNRNEICVFRGRSGLGFLRLNRKIIRWPSGKRAACGELCLILSLNERGTLYHCALPKLRWLANGHFHRLPRWLMWAADRTPVLIGFHRRKTSGLWPMSAFPGGCRQMAVELVL